LRLTFDGAAFEGWPDDLEGRADADRAMLLLGDPFSFPADQWLKRINAGSPGLRVIGGMASAGQAAGRNRLALDGQVFDDGAVAIVLDGPVRVRTVVSQGCRPIGRPMLVTKADRNLIKELGRRPAMEVLRETFDALSEDDQERVRQGLHIGRVINEYQESFHRGDFLVRNVMGADEEGSIAINDLIRVGQTVQFHVRDADSADEDLQSLLEGPPPRPGRRPPGRRLAVQLQRPGHAAVPEPRPRRLGAAGHPRPDPHRRLLRHGRDRPGRPARTSSTASRPASRSSKGRIRAGAERRRRGPGRIPRQRRLFARLRSPQKKLAAGNEGIFGPVGLSSRPSSKGTWRGGERRPRARDDPSRGLPGRGAETVRRFLRA
jgi:hypothetical protein